MNNKFKEFDEMIEAAYKKAHKLENTELTTMLGTKIINDFACKFRAVFAQELIAKQTMKQAMADATVIECCPDAFSFNNAVMKDSETEVKKDGITTGCRGVSCADCWDRVAE